MNSKQSSRRPLWPLIIVAVGLGFIALVACSGPYEFDVTPTPTRTPQPSSTPTPTITPSPTPTPTPAWPVSVGCAGTVPAAACTRLQERVAQDPDHFFWADDGVGAEVQLSTEVSLNATPAGTWVYALAAPFYTIDDGATFTDVQSTWAGTPAGPFLSHRLLVSEDTLRVLTNLWGPPAPGVQAVGAAELLDQTVQQNGWAILPFDELEPRWKVMQIDGASPLWRELDLTTYPLTLPLTLGAVGRTDALPLLVESEMAFSNRDESKMTIVAMTGVTAMTRNFGCWMDAHGNTYAAQDIQELLAGADFTHISNEVSFQPNCANQCGSIMSFCSDDSYIELLEYVGTDIVELTGNHLVDRGIEPLFHTLDLYRERGWEWYGGGENLIDASQPVTITHGPNKIAFFGCNTNDAPFDWATDTLPGVYTCRTADSRQLDPERLAQMEARIQQLREQGYKIIITLQYHETEEYVPYRQQILDFRTFADLGADVVQGSQAHQAQTLEFYGDTFIHYGLGNLFFDQNWEEVRPSFVDRLIFYDGQFLNVDLRPTMMEEYGRRREMTPEEQANFLGMLFGLSPEGE